MKSVSKSANNPAHEIEIYRQILACIDEGIWIVAMDGKTISATSRLEQLLGYQPGELAESLLSELICPRALAATVASLNKNSVGPLESQMVKKGGSSIPVVLKSRPTFDEDGVQEGWLIMVSDIIDKRQLEEKLRQAQKVEALGQLAAGIAHDFNNFLGIVLMESEGLQEILTMDSPPRLREGLEIIRNVSERAASLTKQLLKFSRNCEKSLQATNISVVIGEMRSLLARLIGEGITPSWELASDLGSINIDSAQLQQVIMNLVVNARDAMPRGGKLWIKTMNVNLDTGPAAALKLSRGAYVALTVTDSGQGMTKETANRIFDPFFTTKGVDKGTGLGLATVQEIVKQCSGSVSVKSELGRGSTFQIFFPMVGAMEVKTVEVVDSSLLRGSETILLVEDDLDLRKATSRVLIRNGYQVLEAANGKEALARYGENLEGIDLIITDVVMPEMSGPEFIQTVADAIARKHIPVLFLSGYTDSKLGASHVPDNRSRMTKPVRSKALLEKAHEMLLSRHAAA